MDEIASMGYFHSLLKETTTYPWINSATQKELEAAQNWGAIGATMNPTHPPKAIKADRDLWQPVIDKILLDYPDIADDEVADLVTQRMAKRSAELFFPLFEKSRGEYGYVAVQSNPKTNNDLTNLIKHATSFSQLGANIAPKIPSSKVGLQAVEELTAQGIHTVCTMGFSVAQNIAFAEAYERGLKRLVRNDKAPRCFVVIIPGIFDDYIRNRIEDEKIDISLEILRWAGNAIARTSFKVMKERGYLASLQSGGTRETYHITDVIGDGIHITHSFNTWVKLQEESPAIIKTIHDEIPLEIISELRDKLVEFRQAFDIDGLKPEEFRDFGPCAMFNNTCIKGYEQTLAEVASSRQKVLA